MNREKRKRKKRLPGNLRDQEKAEILDLNVRTKRSRFQKRKKIIKDENMIFTSKFKFVTLIYSK